MKKNNTGVYAIVNKLNGKAYIGSTSFKGFNTRWADHRSCLKYNKHHSSYLQNAWNKYGADHFEFKILEYVVPEDCVDREQFYIDLYMSTDGSYNMLKKARCSPAEISRVLKNLNGHNQTKETRARISEAMTGVPKTDEHRENIRAARLDDKNPMFGKNISNQHKEAIAKAGRRKIIRDDGVVFDSIKDAAEELQCHYQGICASIKKGHRCSGFTFKYFEEVPNDS